MTLNDWITNLYIFVLASFLGLELIRNVSRLLHTPLMSLTNAISSISLVGSLALTGEGDKTWVIVLGTIAIIASSINAVGGFLITDRILKMFRKSK
ncbi:NAD(P) transhydrogenase subunit alpha [Methylacidiphilum sp. Yel]|uniref:NAD(P) transhydrogenase subunit alpha n=1 Tax=Methylacidiphilum sp. Yel TaxID=1847730 RepID=UPI00106C47F1|nr:NAD(P) transhydrogenase subunit alpha [Methylacidiphilum sp. Yel]